MNSYDKVIAIARWEVPELEALGCRKEKIVYIPNGIPEEFTKSKYKFRNKKKKVILFLGRIAPIKNIELLLSAFKSVIDRGHDVHLRLIGQMEKEYGIQILGMIKNLKLEKYVDIPGPIYDLKQKILALEDADIFILPSKREASPQALIEAMALGKIALSSNTAGGREFIEEGKNGFLFDSEEELVKKLEYTIKSFSRLKRISLRARKDVSGLTWKSLARKEEQLYTKS